MFLKKSLIVLFLIIPSLLWGEEGKPVYKPRKSSDYTVRGGIGNALIKLEKGETVNVAYLGGSITETGDGWRKQTTEWMQKNWPNAKVHEIHAAIGATGSDIGVYRFQRDVLNYKPDLLFIEFAVNDGGLSPEKIWKNFEGIIRKTWKANPRTDIVFCYTIISGTVDTHRKGEYPQTANAMEQIADFYDIPSISFGQRVVKMLDEGKLIFKAPKAPEGIVLFSTDGTHPIASGSALYTLDVARAFAAMKSIPAVDHSSKLTKIFIRNNLENAKMVPIEPNMLKGNWRVLKKGERYSNYARWLDQIWISETPGSRIEFQFRGDHAKLYDIPSSDGAALWITVDGKKSGPISRYHAPWWNRLYAFPVAENLDPNKVHTVIVELDSKAPDRPNQDPNINPKYYEGIRYRAAKILLDGDLVP
ncbi:MAG: GDSL-type esterase/lipase family protein [Planctomycetia bacterium]|nr:GDSL-type esterase/lipase family protein [Planctomycetia bacterium]